MRKLFTTLFSLFLAVACLAQADSDKQKAYDQALEAIKLMDSGEIDQSIGILEESIRLDPSNINYPYETAYAFYLKKDYARAVEYFEKVILMDGVTDQCYQMLGNAYDMNGQPEKAITTYQLGLKEFPKSGMLYLELGNMHQGDWGKALEFYEKGIEIDPVFSSNYYWATRIFCSSNDELWGMIYGELFMNMERGTKRTEEISKILFDTYFSEIQFTSDTSVSVSFYKNATISLNRDQHIPFGLVYEPILMLAVTEDEITLESLNRIRKNFITLYFEKGFNQTHPNILFDWHKTLIDNGYFECYNYWILMHGAPDEFREWHQTNAERFEAFIEWFTDHPMPISEKQKFHRSDY
ncbi:tetratricopeptide repeat protein [Gaoshiqia sp. Z1-71]|uniref:tetratricopeptide repeat protein n=1 Tax=Gaoshiqia hydrogeniformans TaxID=3290090 RepID=UPI003BF8A80B